MSEHVYIRYNFDLEIPFFDVDSLYIVWHGHYVKYLELARCALLDALQHNYEAMRQSGFSYPVVKLDLKYVRPAVFGQKIRVECRLVEYESCLRIRYIIRDRDGGGVLTKGSTTQVAVALADGEMQFQTSAQWQDAVRQYPQFVRQIND